MLNDFCCLDNLSIHTNSDIAKASASRKAYMLNIMPHSSHWFQVHNKKPFAILKKLLQASRNNVTSLAHHDPSVRRQAFADNLDKAEKKASAQPVIIKSFKEVGLHP